MLMMCALIEHIRTILIPFNIPSYLLTYTFYRPNFARFLPSTTVTTVDVCLINVVSLIKIDNLPVAIGNKQTKTNKINEQQINFIFVVFTFNLGLIFDFPTTIQHTLKLIQNQDVI